MSQKKREIASMKCKLANLEELESVVEGAIAMCYQLSLANPAFLHDASVSEGLEELSRMVKDNIASMKVVLNLLYEYQSEKDLTTGLIKESFKERHTILTYGIQSLQSTMSSLDACIGKVQEHFRSYPFVQAYLIDLYRVLRDYTNSKKKSLGQPEGSGATTFIRNIDDLFDNSALSEDDQADTSRPSSAFKGPQQSPTAKYFIKAGKFARGIKLSSVLRQEQTPELPLKKAIIRDSPTMAIPNSPFHKGKPSPSNITRLRRLEVTQSSSVVLPPLKSTSRLLHSLKNSVSSDERTPQISVSEIISSHREKLFKCAVSEGLTGLHSGLMSKKR